MAGHASLFWALAGIAGLAGLAPSLEPAAESRAVSAAPVLLTIPRAADGQFYAEAAIEGVRVRMMIDLGGDGVTLATDDARRIGIAPGSAGVPHVALGRLAIDRAPVRIAPALPVSLIGGRYLARFGAVSIEGDRLTIG
jgi:aspartyl protease family protein